MNNLLRRRHDTRGATDTLPRPDDPANERIVAPDDTADGETTGRLDRPTRRRAPREPEAVDDTTAVPDRRPWAHNSAAAVLGLILAIVAAGLVATGLLAPVGVAVGVLGVLVSLAGLVRAGRPGVTGHAAAVAGLLVSLAAIVIGVLAIRGDLSWLDSDTDEVARLHTWLNDTFPWMKRW